MDIAYHLRIPPREQDMLKVREWDYAVAAVKQIRVDIEAAK